MVLQFYMKRRSFLSECVRTAAAGVSVWFTGRQLASAQPGAVASTNPPPPMPRAPARTTGQGEDWAGLGRYQQENSQDAVHPNQAG